MIRLLAVLVILVISITQKAWSQSMTTDSDSPSTTVALVDHGNENSYENVSLRLAQSLKLQADEMYLRSGLPSTESRAAIRKKYSEADVVLSRIERDRREALSESQQVTLDLLEGDVAYRIFLLDNKESFWGREAGRTPTIPIIHIRNMESLLRQLTDLSSEIETLTVGIEDDEESIGFGLAAFVNDVEEKLTLANSEQRTVTITRGDYQNQLNATKRRLREIKQAQIELSQQAEQTSQQLDALQSQMTGLIVTGVTSALGVPTEVELAFGEGSLDERLVAFASDSIGAEADDFISETVRELKNEIGDIAEVYRQGQEAYEELTAAVEDFRQIEQLVETGDISGLIPEARELLEEIPAEQRARFEEIIGDAESGYARGRATLAGAYAIEQSIVGGTFDQLVEAGRVTLKEMDANSYRKVSELVSDIRQPALTLVGASKQWADRIDGLETTRIHAAAARAVAKVQGLSEQRVDEILSLAAIASEKSIVEIYSLLLKQAIDRYDAPDSSVSAETLIRQIVLVWPDEFLAKMGSDAKAALREYFEDEFSESDLTNEALARYFADKVRSDEGFRQLFRMSRGELAIRTRGKKEYTVVIDSALDIPSASPLTFSSRELEERLRTATKMLVAEFDSSLVDLLEYAPVKSLQQEMERYLGAASTANESARRTKRLWNEMKPELSSSSVGEVEEISLQLQMGTAIVLSKVTPDTGPTGGGTTPFTSTGAGIQTNEADSGADVSEGEVALVMALNSAIPGAGVALQLIHGFGQFNRMVDRMKDLDRTIQVLVAEEYEAQARFDELDVAIAIAEQEALMAAAKRRAAERAYAIYSAAVTRKSAELKDNRERIARRRALTFYLAERLRQEFDALDRSIAFWAGTTNSPRGEIERRIRTDPRNIRYALDADIHLYEWLDRDIESTRIELDPLVVHWQQLYRLVYDVCQKIGCVPGNSSMGSVQETLPRKVSALVSDFDFQRFLRWRRSGDGQLELSIVLTPDALGLPDHHQNVRVVDVRLSGIRGGQRQLLPAVGLSHPGLAMIRSNIGYEPEALLPVISYSLSPTSDSYDMEELRTRWAKPTPVKREFEGYGLYTTWTVLLEPTPENRQVDDIEISFAYQYIGSEDEDSRVSVFGEEEQFTDINLVRLALANLDRSNGEVVSCSFVGRDAFPYAKDRITAVQRMFWWGNGFSRNGEVRSEVTSDDGNLPISTQLVVVPMSDEDLERSVLEMYSSLPTEVDTDGLDSSVPSLEGEELDSYLDRMIRARDTIVRKYRDLASDANRIKTRRRLSGQDAIGVLAQEKCRGQ